MTRDPYRPLNNWPTWPWPGLLDPWPATLNISWTFRSVRWNAKLA